VDRSGQHHLVNLFGTKYLHGERDVVRVFIRRGLQRERAKTLGLLYWRERCVEQRGPVRGAVKGAQPGFAVAGLGDGELGYLELPTRCPIKRLRPEGDDARTGGSLDALERVTTKLRGRVKSIVETIAQRDFIDDSTESDSQDVTVLE
jgi:hypothetical protein